MTEERALDAQQTEHRWRGRRVQALVVRALTVVIPLAASIAAGATTSRLLPKPEGIAELLSWWTIMLAVASATMLGTDRLTRRLLPLAALLKLTLIFPDQAPSRFRVAVRAGGTRRLEQKLEDVKTKGLEHTPAEAAATVLELASMLNVHDRKTRGHSERVRVFADLLADELKLAKPDRDRLHWAALLHDVGKLVVPHDILNKQGKPTDEEWAILQSHPLEGEKFVEPLAEWLGEWAKAIGQHHEKYDGTGYPRGLAGQDISMAARIVAVADSYEVMTAARAYKRPMPAAEARRELARCAGTQFDPMVVRAFLNISVGKLRLAMGPLSWLAQLPFAQFLPQVGTAASGAASTAVATASTAAAMVLGGVVEAPAYAPSTAAAADDAPDADVPRGDKAPPSPPSPLAPEAPADPEVGPAPARAGAPTVRDDHATVSEDESVAIRAIDNDQRGTDPLAPATMRLSGTESIGGTVRHDGRGTIEFAPHPDRNGVVTFGYELCDEDGRCDDGKVTVRILPVNDAPVARSDAAATDEDVATSIPVLANDSDVDGDRLSVVRAWAATGAVSVNSDGTLTYTPEKEWDGTDELRYEITDGNGAFAIGAATVIVTGKNDDPIAVPDASGVDEDASVTVDVLANDHDPDPLDRVTLTGAGGAAHGTVAVAGSSVSYTPAPDWSGVDSFTYTVSDGRGGTAQSTVTVTVKPLNDKPVANGDVAKVAEDEKSPVDVLANDTDPDIAHGDALEITGASGASMGTVSVERGAIVYTPKADTYGTDTVTYTVRDKAGATATATVVLTVTPVNDAPIAKNVKVESGKDEPLVELTLEASDPKDEKGPGYPAKGIAGYKILTTPTGGILYYDSGGGTYVPAVAGVTTANPVVKFTPPAGQIGSFSFTYAGVDAGHPAPGLPSAPATGTIVVSGGRLMVGYQADGSDAVGLRGAKVHGLAYVFLDDSFGIASASFWLDDPAMSGTPHSADSSPRLDFNGGTAFDTGALQPGSHSITAKLTRDDGSTSVVTARFEVEPNLAPTAAADNVQVAEDASLDIAVLANDSDGNGDPLEILSITAPSNGTAVLKPDGKVRYTPTAEWFGTDTFTYTISDGHGATSVGTVTVTVTPVADGPVAVDDVDAANLLGFVNVPVLDNDTDLDNDIDPGTVTITRPPEHGTATAKPDGTVDYAVLLILDSGVDSFAYEVCDESGLCASAEVLIGFNNVAPTAGQDNIGTAEGVPVTFTAVSNDNDPNPWDEPLIASVDDPANGTATISADRKKITYTPDPDWNGLDTFTYRITDGLLTATGTIKVNVGAVNDPPVAQDDNATTTVDLPVMIDVLANDTDVDGDILTIADIDDPITGSVTQVGNQIQYTPPAGAFGTDTFTYTVTDGFFSSTATVNIVINAIPVVNDDAKTIDEDEGQKDIDVLDNDSDADGGTLTITAVGGTALGTVSISGGDHLHYTPNPDAYGTDSFTYTVSDGISSVTGMVTVTINPKPDDPVAMDDDVLTTSTSGPVTFDPLVNDIDADADLVPGSVVVQDPSHGTATVDATTGQITYTPEVGWSGTETFNYTVCDATGRCDQGQVRVTVRTPPQAVDDTDSTSAGQSVNVSILTNDIVGDAPITTVTIVTPPSNGVAQILTTVPKRIRYDPAPGFTGTDTFTYQVTDANGYTSTATVTITVI